jgi:hypothetical protein
MSFAYYDMGVYCQAVIDGDGTKKKRTEWQEGWNAYGSALLKKTSIIDKWLRSLPEDAGSVVRLLEEDRLCISVDESEPDAPRLVLMVNCNDLFYWACADAEEITLAELPALEQALQESPTHGDLLWCARKRQMRPQAPYYKGFTKEEVALFDAAGPEREDSDGKR